MIVSRLTLKNWRKFRSLDLKFSERVVLIGPNASGKSNLLDVFRFLRDLARPAGGLQPGIAQRGGLSKVRCLAARSQPDVEIMVELSHDGVTTDWRYSIGITQQVRGFRQPVLRHEKVWKGDKLILDRPNPDDRNDDLRLTQTHLEQISANADFREIARFFESIRYLLPGAAVAPASGILLRHGHLRGSVRSHLSRTRGQNSRKNPQVPFETD